MEEVTSAKLKRQHEEESSDDEELHMSVTLLRHSGTKRVLYMEAGKDFVDLLLSFLLLPVGTILNRLAGKSVSLLGAIDNVAGSVAKLGNSCLYVDKSVLLTPELSVGSSEHLSQAALLQLEVSSEPCEEEGQRFFACNMNNNSITYNRQLGQLGNIVNNCSWRTQKANVNCPDCRLAMTREVWLKEVDGESVKRNSVRRRAASRHAKAGFVEKTMTFIVTDDLQISPASTIKSINILNDLKVASMSELESCEARVGAREALKLLAASFTSRNVLNDVFGPRVIISK